jgi:hypothetical protein
VVTDQDDSVPSADRERSYSGGYMKVGRMGEDVAFAVLKDYRARGVDAILKMRGSDRFLMVEVKTDNHLDVSGRWLFELYRIYLTVPNANAMIEGWSIRSEAEWLIFYAPATRRLHFIKMEEYRRAHIEAAASGKCHYSLVATDRIKRTLNAYFPKEFVEKMESYRVYQVPEILP